MKINTYHACSGLKVCSTTVIGATSSLFFTVLPVSVSVMHVMPFGHATNMTKIGLDLSLFWDSVLFSH